jgi:hypothetical protein
MKTLKATGVLALGALAALLPIVPAESQQKKETDKKPATAVVAAPVYKPPLRGAPGGRLGGGTRGTGSDVFVLSALAPDHSGLTLQEQPSLYWYISKPTSLPVEFTIMDPTTVQPILEMRIPSPVAAGIHRIRLADHGIRLAPDRVYRWYLAIVPDTGRRSRDILAGGTIQRVEPTAELSTRLREGRPDDVPSIYAEAGLWYDALAAMSELIERDPGDAQLRQRRAALVAQIGLPPTTEQ